MAFIGYNKEEVLLTESLILSSIRVPKDGLEEANIHRDLLLQDAKNHVLARASKYLSDGRKYHVKITQTEGDLEYPVFVNFKEYKTQLEIYLLDAEQCKLNEVLIRNSPISMLEDNCFVTQSGKQFKLVRDTETTSVWRRIN